MSKKHFITIAACLADARPVSTDRTNIGVNAAHHAIDCAARDMADRFAVENPRFDRARFLFACGVES